MQEKDIFKISLIITILGLVFLFVYAEEVDVKPTNDLESRQVDEKVTIAGTINRITIADKAVFLSVTGQRIETMSIIFFPEEEPFLKVGDYVEVSGVVEEYKGKKEVIAESVVVK